jgi:hypothetical protein
VRVAAMDCIQAKRDFVQAAEGLSN